MRIPIFFLGLLIISAGLFAQTRTVEHAMGKTEVPMSPKRVVVLDAGALDASLLMGILPVGSVDVFGSGMVPAYLAEILQGREKQIANVGLLSQPSLEKILLLKPDLILTATMRHKSIYGQLSKIAPTVMAGEHVGSGWQENFLLYARSLGVDREGQALLASYQEKAKNLGQKLKAKGKLPTISIIRFFASTETRIYREATFIGTILSDIGLSFPDNPAYAGKGILFVSEESIPAMDADVLFYSFYADPREGRPVAEANRADFFKNPLWLNLKVNKAGRSFKVNDDHWMTGTGLLASLKVLEDLERILLGN